MTTTKKYSEFCELYKLIMATFAMRDIVTFIHANIRVKITTLKFT